MKNRAKILSMATITIIVTLAIMASSLSVSAANVVSRGESTSGVTPADNRVVTKSTISQITSYEQITDFGLNPQSRELEATVSINKLSGYNGFEFVGIWVDWNDNGKFESNELAGITQFFATNSPAGTYLPISYTVKIKANPPQGFTTALFKDRKARAIVSFNTPPTSPTSGNTIDRVVKFDAIN